MGCYYGFENRANDLATHGINRFAYANRTPHRWAQKQRKPLRTKTFAYANGEFPYAKVTCHPCIRRASAVETVWFLYLLPRISAQFPKILGPSESVQQLEQRRRKCFHRSVREMNYIASHVGVHEECRKLRSVKGGFLRHVERYITKVDVCRPCRSQCPLI